MSKEKNNLEFWNSVEKTDPNHTKPMKQGGRTITSISAQYQIKNATGKWGMYGETWGIRSVELNYLKELSDGQIMCVAQAEFFYPNGHFDIGSSILVQSWVGREKKYHKVDDDFLKKLETDMTTKALSKLGFNADVFMGRFDDNKYVAKMQQEFNVEKPKAQSSNTKKTLTAPIATNIMKQIKESKIKDVEQYLKDNNFDYTADQLKRLK